MGARGRRKREAAVHASSAGLVRAARVGWDPQSLSLIGLCAIVMVLPLAVLGDATGPYDDFKAWVLPLLVALTGLVRLAVGGTRDAGPLSTEDKAARALRWSIWAFLGWALVTTAASIAPGQSVFGLFGRGMGLVTVWSAALLFFLVQSECRDPRAIRRLIDAALLGSVPVCLLALAQAAGLDPLPMSWDPAVAGLRVRSTLGQHIFLGGYLAVLIPLAAGRLDAIIGSRGTSAREPERPDPALGTRAACMLWVLGTVGLVWLASGWTPAWWLMIPWGVLGATAWVLFGAAGSGAPHGRGGILLLAALIVLQVAVVVLSRARGPLLAMLLGLSATGFTLLARRRAWKPLAAATAALAAVLLLIALLNVPHSPLASLRGVSVLSRLGQLTDTRRGTPVGVRLGLWRGILSGWVRQLGGDETVPDTSPRLRSLIGYGLETQFFTLDRLSFQSVGLHRARGVGWHGHYRIDRAHNALLDQLVTGGLIGVGLWLVLVTALLLAGISRVRSAVAGEEVSIRLGCLGAVLAHLADGQVGVVTATPLALFWLAAALLASASWTKAGTRTERRVSSTRHGWGRVATGVLALLAALIIWFDTRWLLASIAYASGARQGMAGQLAEARAEFQRSRELAPWLALPAESFAYTSLRIAATESTETARLDVLRQAEVALGDARRRAPASTSAWVLTAQTAFGEFRAGERNKLALSLEAFDRAVRLRPHDPELMAEWGWALLESGDPQRARGVAEQAVRLQPRRPEWLPWALLSRSAGALGDSETAQRAADTARRLAPVEAQRFVDRLLSDGR